MHHAEVGYLRKIPVEEQVDFPSESEGNSCPETGIFRKYPHLSVVYLYNNTANRSCFLNKTIKKNFKNTNTIRFFFKSQKFSQC